MVCVKPELAEWPAGSSCRDAQWSNPLAVHIIQSRPRELKLVAKYPSYS